MKKITAILFFFAFTFGLMAQNTEECASGIIHQRLLQNDPEYASRIQMNESLIQHVQKTSPISKSGSILQIPLVVHVIHTGQAVGVGANISMSQITSAIDTLNARYRNFQGSSVDTEIEFVLAKRDPNGNVTNGVVRVDGSSVSLYATEGITAGNGSGANEIDVKNLSRWPNTQYYNIWVVTEIEDNDGLFGIQGYAYFPGANQNIDGTVIMNTCFGTTGTVNSFNNRNRTLVHEIGHGFNLYHTFEGDASGTTCPSTTNGCGSGVGDCVADTDPHIRAASNCPTGTNSCTGNSIDGVTSNFMNYSSQTCAVNFTSGQSSRMRAAILASRPSLITSLGAVAPSGSSLTSASCIPITSNTNNGFGFGLYEFNFSDVHVVSDGTVDEGGYVDQTNHQLISVIEGGTYPMSINTGSANNEDIEVYIDYNNDGDFLDAGEVVMTSSNSLTHADTIHIPASGATTNTPLRLRVISDWHSNTITGSCYNPTYGQTEDYALYIAASSSPLSLSISLIDISCKGAADGTAVVTASGGETPYTYLWSSGQTTASINNLVEGHYLVTVTDNNGDFDTLSTFINEPEELKSQIIMVNNISAVGATDAELVAWSRGGTQPINYLWDDASSQTTRKATSLSAGTYTVTLSDANGCTDVSSLTIGLGACPSSITPTNLKAKYLSSTSALIDWEEVNGTNVYYLIRYKEAGANAWQTLFTTAADSLAVNGLNPNTSYLYIVKTNCNGIWSDQAFSSFKTLNNDCANPSGVTEQWILTDQAKLKWNAANHTSKYEIRYRDSSQMNWNNIFINANFDYYWLSSLTSRTTYEWQIRSYCRFDEATAQRWSNSHYFTTKGSVQNSPNFRTISNEINKNQAVLDIHIYPNPTSGQFVLDLGRMYENIAVKILDLSGRLINEEIINEKSSITINPDISESGVYLVKITTPESRIVKQLVIQK
tara:strand:+ start:23858 stop:26680 length:2823 start_codon:yes stop_codon:yes gene_type:complete